MSRFYEMTVEISGHASERGESLKAAAEYQWPFEDLQTREAEDGKFVLEGFGQSFLSGGEGEEEFADRLARAVWQANGGYCRITVAATYLENLPFEEYCFDDHDYARMMGDSRNEPDDQ